MLATIMSIAVLIVNAPEKGEKWTFGVGPVHESARNVLLEAVMDSPGEPSHPHLRVSGTTADVPCQAHASRDGRTAIYWLVPTIKEGESLRWDFSWGPGKECLHPKISVELISESDGKVRVEVGNKIFTRYVFGNSEYKPYLYPIFLDGHALTRHYPMKQGVPGERE